MQYTVNSIIVWKNKGEKVERERVLWLDNEFVYVIDIDKNKFPYLRTKFEIDEAILQKDVFLLEEDPYIVVLNEDDIPKLHKEKRDKTWELIKDYAQMEPDIFYSRFRRKAIKKIAQSSDIRESTIAGYFKRYWIRGKTPNALLPDYRNCGARGKERAVGKAKRGRPRKNKDIAGIGVNVTEDIKKIFRIAINKYYYTTAKNSLVLTYELMRKEYFTEGYKEQNGIMIPILKPQLEIPSFGQFRYWFYKERNLKKEITSRYSNKKYLKDYRPVIGTVAKDVLQPGTFEIDCQVADVYLVSRFNRNWIIGRPAIYAVIDKFSRVVAGIYIGLESGSYVGAIMALLNAATDKVKFCKQYGIEIEEKDWPVHHLPETIIADRGELEGGNIENLINTLNIKVQNTPPYRADLKSIVERYFGLTNERVKPFLPGVVNVDERERGNNDYRLDARLDLYQFTQIIIKCVLYHNNFYHMDTYIRDEAMIEDNVPSIPMKIWDWGIANRGGTLRTVPEDVLKLALMPTDIATVTEKGIKFKDMYYVSSEMLKGQAFVRARANGTWRVKISYDPRDLSYIYVHDENLYDYQKCFLADSSNRYKNKALEEIEYLLAVERMQKVKNQETEAQAKTQLIAEIEDIVERAERAYRSETNIIDNDKQRIRNIRENRRVERAAIRAEEVFEIGNKDEEVMESVLDKESLDKELNSLALLFRKQREKLTDG